MIEESTITCPRCSHQATERMPADACQFFYVCKDCGENPPGMDLTVCEWPRDCGVLRRRGTIAQEIGLLPGKNHGDLLCRPRLTLAATAQEVKVSARRTSGILARATTIPCERDRFQFHCSVGNVVGR